MATVKLTAATFEKTIAEGIVFVDYWASWCGPCLRFGPTFEKASEKYPDIVFGKVDTEDERDLAAAAGIMSIPTISAFRDGILVFNQSGVLSPSALDQVVDAVRNLDMEQVKKKIAEQQK